ncbi:MAG: deoxyguanosinetriphosphate triphosphohydrolase [Firmicutes bacterium]|nr:deoxyguanosinetriphosphate triphosphohydrolase [Bacillota bacterium]MBQ3122687.1 deoxyguanosinetriphosphate triphosphohydrolase [Bacillota bacterium]
MLKREDIEKREYEMLSPFAAKSAESLGRDFPEEKCEFRTEFQRDRDRIIHSKAFRRLMHKTQVFLAPEGDHFRTRLTHTIEVSQIARTVARGLGLNEDLTEAIALGHDLGHTPFGHTGESILAEIHPGGFEHNEQSLRVVEVLESQNGRKGMNLTKEVRDGILNHTGPGVPFTLEGQIVKISDRIAYINHDIDDALRSGVITIDELPKECLEVLGYSHSIRINTLVSDLIENSVGKDRIIMSEERLNSMNTLRSFMFENVYHNNKVKRDEDLAEVENIIRFLYRFYMENPERLPEERKEMIKEYGINEVVKDQVAGMTDRYATNIYYDLLKESR